jgi:hypothetical protein
VRLFTVVLAAAALSVGCGLDLQSPDVFLLTRVGAGKRLTLLINDSGTVSCNGGKPKRLPGPLLLQARDLATALDKDITAKLRIAAGPGTVYRYTVKLQDGTLSFPDTAGAEHTELAATELLTVQVAEGPCGLSGQ